MEKLWNEYSEAAPRQSRGCDSQCRHASQEILNSCYHADVHVIFKVNMISRKKLFRNQTLMVHFGAVHLISVGRVVAKKKKTVVSKSQRSLLASTLKRIEVHADDPFLVRHTYFFRFLVER